MTNRLFKTSLLVASMLLAAGAVAHPPKHHPLKDVLRQLDLTDSQQQEVRQIVQDAKAGKERNGEERRAFRQELQNLIQSDIWQEEQVRALLESQVDDKSARAFHRSSTLNQIWLILEDEQQAELATLLTDDRSGEREQKKGHFPFHRLDLSDEQKVQLMDLKQAVELARDNFRPTAEAFKAEQLALSLSEQFSEDAWQQLELQYADAFLDRAVAQAGFKHQMWNVLTEEQQAKLQEKMQHRKGKGKRKG